MEELRIAIAQQDIERVHALIRAGVDVNTTDAYRFIPLMQAVFAGNAPIVSALLKAGANVNVSDYEGCPVVLMAHRSVPVMKLLLGQGAHVDARTHSTPEAYGGSTALMGAVQWALLEMTALLVEAGADVNAATEAGTTVLMWAVRQQPTFKQTHYGLDPTQRPAVVAYLLQHGAGVDAQNAFEQTVWNFAEDGDDTESNREQILALLRQAGAKE